MTNFRIATLAVVALLSVSCRAARGEAADASSMTEAKMIISKPGKATGPMDHEMTMPDGHKVMPDGTMKMNDGKEMRMQEGQMMTLDGKMMDGGHGMMGGKGMKMEGMDK